MLSCPSKASSVSKGGCWHSPGWAKTAVYSQPVLPCWVPSHMVQRWLGRKAVAWQALQAVAVATGGSSTIRGGLQNHHPAQPTICRLPVPLQVLATAALNPPRCYQPGNKVFWKTGAIRGACSKFSSCPILELHPRQLHVSVALHWSVLKRGSRAVATSYFLIHDQ